MKVAIISDQHFGCRGDSLIFSQHQEKFYKKTFIPYIKKHNIKEIYMLGDTFDRRKFINFNSLQRAKKFYFEPLEKMGVKLHMIVGNHDIYFKNHLDVNSPELLLQEYSNITIYSKPQEIMINKLKVVMMPWICSENYEDAFKLIDNTDARVLFGHLEIQGFEMYKGSVMFCGYDKSKFSKFDTVLTGHYHHKSTQGNITYVGSPYEMTWSDFNDPRGFHIFDSDTLELTYHQNPFKMFLKIKYDDLDKKEDEVLPSDYKQYKGSYVKVIVRNKLNPIWFDTMIDELEKVGVNQIQVVEDHLNLDELEDDDLIDEAEDTLTVLTKSIKSLNKSVDEQKLESLLRELYSEALVTQG